MKHQKLVVYGQDAVMVASEIRADVTAVNSYRWNEAEKREHIYRPTTLVMLFPPGELERLRGLLNG